MIKALKRAWRYWLWRKLSKYPWEVDSKEFLDHWLKSRPTETVRSALEKGVNLNITAPNAEEAVKQSYMCGWSRGLRVVYKEPKGEMISKARGDFYAFNGHTGDIATVRVESLIYKNKKGKKVEYRTFKAKFVMYGTKKAAAQPDKEPK